jgi:hypothetical protein
MKVETPPFDLPVDPGGLRQPSCGGIIRAADLDRGIGVRERLTDEEEAAMNAELARLRQEHRDLDAAISALEQVGAPDRLQLQRLKKRKLNLRDRIAFLEDQLTPDIIA